MAINTERALSLAKVLRQYNEEEIRFIHDISGNPGLVKEWTTAESELIEMEEIVDALSNISWEEKYQEISDLLSDAERSRDERREKVNKIRKNLDLELLDE
jgi:hypothetical protein